LVMLLPARPTAGADRLWIRPMELAEGFEPPTG
jgi:hypothetical protein